MRAKYTDMDDLKRQEESRLQRIVRAKEDLITAERELEELPVYKPPKDELVCLFHNYIYKFYH